MLRAIESFVKRSIPQKQINTGHFRLALFDSPHSPTHTVVSTGAVDWYAHAQHRRRAENKPSAAFAAELSFSYGYSSKRLYLPMVAFANNALGVLPGSGGNRASAALWSDLRDSYPGKRLLVFEQGLRLCAFVEALLETQERDDWLDLLTDHSLPPTPTAVSPVDREWVMNAKQHGLGGMLGVVSTQYPEPRLRHWVNL